MAPTPRSLQCKELTWQPPKHTFCKALSGLFSTKQLGVRIEACSRPGKGHRLSTEKMSKIRAIGRKIQILKLRAVLGAAVMFYSVLSCFTFSCGNIL